LTVAKASDPRGRNFKEGQPWLLLRIDGQGKLGGRQFLDTVTVATTVAVSLVAAIGC